MTNWITNLLEADPCPRPLRPADPIRNVTFICNAPSATRVYLSGDFNHWHKTAAPMRRMSSGGWVRNVALHHGHHQYHFLVDGQPTLDPRALGKTQNDRGESASLIAVS